MDPGYWHPAYQRILASCVLPLAPFGDFIAHIRYGPIVTGRRPPHPPSANREGWLPVVHQGQVTDSGVDLRGAVWVPIGSPWDRPSARLQPGDIALPRSGVGSVARNRVAVYLADQPAVVGSFVDLVRLQGLEPIYALLCLKTELVWSQIHRLINGVGTPNISFGEVRSLQLPLAPDDVRAQLCHQYLKEVHRPHLLWLAGDQEAGTRAVRALQQLIHRLDVLINGGA